MFGYIMPRMEELSSEERDRYHAVYCGLCRALGNRCGQHCRLALTYDMTFLALVLGSLYEPDEREGCARCAPHPLKPHTFVNTEYVDYAADMSVALMYHKCLDDWHDDRSVRGRAFAAALEHPYREVSARHPGVCAAIEQGLEDIAQLEKAAATGDASQIPAPDVAANRFAALLGEVFVYRYDFWADGLRSLGSKLGKFVYVMDAALDIDKDRESGSYNPLVIMDISPEDIHEDLQLLAAEVAAAFEKLPLERDARVLRSVLYAGMWQAYQAKDGKKNPADKNRLSKKEARRG